MEIINRIDKLIAQLNSLKPELSDDLSGNEKKFSDLLKSSVELSSEISDPSAEIENLQNKKASNVTPDWVDKNHEYNIQNPRKPNMRELMEAISGKSVDELYSEPEESWRKINNQAADLLYGVVGSNIDTRDWASIMSSENILKSLKEQTGIMYEPTLDILSSFDENNNLTKQTAVIKDKEGNTLRSIPETLPLAEETLRNFGANSNSIPNNLEAKVNPNFFDKNLLTFLKNFDKNSPSIQQVVVQSASEAIASKLSQEIPLDELAKL